MSRRLRVAAAAALLAVGCSRDLELPGANPVTISPAVAAAAPRERLQLAASGGAGAYRFAFAAGGRLSGPDAALDPATGLYRAGSTGPAQDVVVVTDASGRTAQARVTVGTPLAASPLVAITTPGGEVSITATGGKPPYTFSLVDAQPLSTLHPAPDGLSATYRAGPAGDREDTIEIRDATWDAADGAHAVALASVRLGAAVAVYANTSGAVAPHEGVDFLAVGGQPPYTFLFANAGPGQDPPSGGSIGPTGRYAAGPLGSGDGSVFDDVTVRDAHGQVAAPIRITVGAPLALSLPVVRLSPNVPASLVATGGKPPYRFGFDVRGNRTNGTVDAVTGAYVPGNAQGASDRFAVTDATGRARAVASGPAIGYRTFAVGQGPRRSLEARLRGEVLTSGTPIHDALIFRYWFASLVGVSSLFFPRGMDPFVETGFSPAAEGEPFALDLDDDGQDELVVFRGGEVAVFSPDLTGALAFQAEHAVPTLPAAYGVARSPGERARFVTSAPCPGGVVDVDLLRTPVEGCVAAPALLAGSLVVADLDGDGLQDLAAASPAGVTIGYGDGAGFGTVLGSTAASLSFPPGCSWSYQTYPTQAAGLVAAPPYDPSDPIPRLHVPLTCSGKGLVGRVDARARGAAAWSPASPVDVGLGSTAFRIAAHGFGRTTAADLVAWEMNASRVVALSFDALGAATTYDPLPGPLGQGLQYVSFPDVDGDGVPDLLAAGVSDSAYVLLGDGDGRFGAHARVGGLGIVTPLHLDGDALGDLVAGSATENALLVLFGGEHQLARGPVTPTLETVGALTAGDLGAGYPEVLFQGRTGRFFRARIFPDGTFGPQQALATTNVSYLPVVGNLRITTPGSALAADLWATYATSPTPSLAILRLDGQTSSRLFLALLPWAGCKYAPVGAGDATAPADVVAACVSGNDLVLRRATYPYDAWSDLATWPGAAGTAAVWAVAARDRHGNGCFVGAPAGAASREVRVVTVRPGAARTAPFTVQAATLGPASAVPSRAGILSDLDGDGVQDLVLSREGRAQLFPGVDEGGWLSFSAGPTFSVPMSGGLQFGLQLAEGAGRDLLLKLGDSYLILAGDGGTGFR